MVLRELLAQSKVLAIGEQSDPLDHRVHRDLPEYQGLGLRHAPKFTKERVLVFALR